MQIRAILNLLEYIETEADPSKAFVSASDNTLAPQSNSSNVTPTPTAVKPEPKAPPGGYTGKGQVRDFYKSRAIISNPEAWDQLQSKDGEEAWRQIQNGKYKGQDWKTIPMDVRRSAGIHDDQADILDAPWHYNDDSTIVTTPRGYSLSGSEHKGFEDPNAPAGVLKIPPIKTLVGGSSDKHNVAKFLVRSGHDDASIARSLKHYFPDMTDERVGHFISSTRDFTRAGYNVGKSIAIDSPHDHDANPMGPFSHSGAIPGVDKGVAATGLGIMYDNGRDPKEAAKSIKSAYKTKSGANTWHTYDEVDPEFENGMQYAMANSYKVGNFTVSETDEIGDDGEPTGRKVIYAQTFGKYLGGPKGKGLGSMTSYWHGTPDQWKKDKTSFLAHLKDAG